MPKGNPNPSPAIHFSADNPGRAKQKGARDRLSAAFLTDFADDYEAHGKAVIETVRGLSVMSDVIDMTDELAHAAEKTDAETEYKNKTDRQSRSYAVLETLVTSSLRQSGYVTAAMADYLKASPELGYWLARWQGEN